MRIKKLLNPRFLILLATIVISLFYAYVPNLQTWASSNMTIIASWEQETKMSGTVLIGLGILVVGSFIYLIYDALKESGAERLEKKLDELIDEIRQDRAGRNRDK